MIVLINLLSRDDNGYSPIVCTIYLTSLVYYAIHKGWVKGCIAICALNRVAKCYANLFPD